MADRAQDILDGCSHIRCEVCGGSGKVCPSCDTHDSGEDHDCDLTERACRVCDGSGRKWPSAPCRACADRAIEAAREEEREACALIAEHWNNRAIPSPIAAAIRARGTTNG